MTYWLSVYTLWNRELVRFYRQPSRVVGALGTAVLFWGVLGTGIGGSATRVYFFPGTLVMSMLFTCIFSNASVIEDRQAGFLQSVLVAPVSRGALVMGKILGGATLAFCQGAVLLALGFTVGASFTPGGLLGLLVSLFLTAFVLTGMGFWLAWTVESSPGFHTLMNLILLPLWMASGAVFSAPPSSWLGLLMKVNPLTYGVAAIRRGLFPGMDAASLPSLGLCWAVLLALGLGLYAFSAFAVEKSKIK
ncbi:MAG TPA: ABC transporter permease [bacterium]|nr:ABC transporter permease [bacterium]